MDENAQREKAEIAVGIFRARGRGERNSFDHLEQCVFRIVAAEVEVVGIVSKACGMAEQVAHGDLAPGRGRVGKIPGQRIVEAYFAFSHQHHHRRGSELLAHRSGLKNSLRFYRDFEFQVRAPVPLGADNFAVARHQQGEARDMACLHLPADELIDGGVERGLGSGRRRSEQPHSYEQGTTHSLLHDRRKIPLKSLHKSGYEGRCSDSFMLWKSSVSTEPWRSSSPTVASKSPSGSCTPGVGK